MKTAQNLLSAGNRIYSSTLPAGRQGSLTINLALGLGFLLLFINPSPSNASTQDDIDSLELQLPRIQVDTTKVNVYNKLSKCYRSKSTERAMEYVNLAYGLAVRIDHVPGLAQSMNYRGIVNEIIGNYDEAITDYLRALKLNERLGSKKGRASNLNNIGMAYYYIDKYDQAKKFFIQALEIRREMGDMGQIAHSLNNVAVIYYEQKQFKQALDYYNKSLIINQKQNNRADIAASFNNIGAVYEELEEYYKAINYYKRSLKIYLDLGDPTDISRSYFNISDAYTDQGEYKEAVEYLDKSYEMIQHLDVAETKKEIFKSYAEVYSKIGNFKDAYMYQSKHFSMRDSIMGEETYQQISDLETRYETERMEKEMELMRKQNEIDELESEAKVNRQRLMTVFSIIAFILVAIIGAVIYNRYRLKQKALSLLSIKNRQITDSINYAKRIQEAILPPNSLIKKEWPESFVMFKPKDVVSGDFYWFSHHNDKSFIAAVDCTGHGVPGAFMSLIGNTLLNEIVHEKEASNPADILKLLQAGVVSSLKQGDEEATSRDGMDIAFCTIDKVNMQLQYAGAHNPLYLVRDGELHETKGDKLFIGDDRFGSDFENHTIELKEGDCLYTFTDGYADQIGGPNDRKFYYQPFQELIVKNSGLPMEEQKTILDSVINRWMGEGAQIDDMLIVGLRV